MNQLKEKSIRYIKDFPKKGILFRDLSPFFSDYTARKDFEDAIRTMYDDIEVTHVVGLESRGFIFGVMVAHVLGVPFIMCRKQNKLPGECYSMIYELEYGVDVLDIQKDAIPKDASVLIVDDILATGGTLGAAISLVRKFGVKDIMGLCFLEIRDEGLKGREYLQERFPDVFVNSIIFD